MKIKMIRLKWLVGLAAIIALGAALILVVKPLQAGGASPLHPTFPLLDADGNQVQNSGQPVSTLRTCGACHDAEFIAEHNAHQDILTGALDAPAGETILIDPQTGQLYPLGEAGQTVEMNCFLCHTDKPDNTARLAALMAGEVEWANTATLAGTGLVEQTAEGYTWNPAAFDAQGDLLPAYVTVQDPSPENCGTCHGVATTDAITPLVLDTCSTVQRTTVTTGQVFSPQRIADSGLNLVEKDSLDRTWDVHAERVVGCTDCHYALNNPAYAAEPADNSPEHLVFDPRRLEPGEYLEKPVHEFARAGTDQTSNQHCLTCHDADSTHKWLPYTDRHVQEVACESCHVPRLEAPAHQTIDWTVLAATQAPVTVCRGTRDEGGEQPLIEGYEAVLLPRANADGSTLIAPYNLITTWFWVYGLDATPVALDDLQAAYFENGTYHPGVLAAFDADGSGTLDESELFIDTDEKQAVIAGRLAALGLDNPRIASRVDAYEIHHGVTTGEWAIRDCATCHGDDSRLAAPILLADQAPGGVSPAAGDGAPFEGGQIVTGSDGAVTFQPLTGSSGSQTYIFGYSSVKVVDLAGVVIFLGTLAGATVHGGLRYFSAKRRVKAEPEIEEHYMYSVYERLWHWLQTAAILLLVLTGLIIHKPEVFGMFSFAYVVQVHNILAAILVINAGLALFYHLASGQIRQYLPEPRGFFGQAILQAKFYLRGIFKGDAHPFEKRPERKLNPLQQITYLGLLNVLLPAQIISGALMWGVQRWPALANLLGGLPVLAPIHTLVAWLFASFVVMHVYLTTTGHEPLASMRGMVMGWDEVEVPGGAK